MDQKRKKKERKGKAMVNYVGLRETLNDSVVFPF